MGKEGVSEVSDSALRASLPSSAEKNERKARRPPLNGKARKGNTTFPHPCLLWTYLLRQGLSHTKRLEGTCGPEERGVGCLGTSKDVGEGKQSDVDDIKTSTSSKAHLLLWI